MDSRAHPDERHGRFVALPHGVAELSGQNPSPREADEATLRCGCEQEVEPVLLQPVVVQNPGDDAGPGGRFAEVVQRPLVA